VNGAKSGAAERKQREFGTVGQGGVASVSTHAQGLVEKLARQAKTTLELATTNTRRLPGLPARGSGNGTQPEPGARRWSEDKSRRGRPKAHDSRGQACMNPFCEYYKDTDPDVHARRRDGQRNGCGATDQWECGACEKKHTARWGTPLYQRKTSKERVTLATHLAMKGMSIADISEVMGHRPTTIARWLERDGQHSERLHEQLFKNLVVVHIQLDELVTRVRRWAKRGWVWTAQDAQSKAWLAWYVGGRTQADAHRIVHRVTRVLASTCVPAFTSDGLRQYFYALTAHFGVWVEEEGKRKPVWQALPSLLYGQFRKVKVGRRLKQVYTKMLCGERSALQEVLQSIGLSGGIQTSYVERLNLTIRHMVAALRRRTWALAGGPGGGVLQFLPPPFFSPSGDRRGTLPAAHPSHGLRGDRAPVECRRVCHPSGVLRAWPGSRPGAFGFPAGGKHANSHREREQLARWCEDAR
jgi:transposase-like protein/IS1 family transposase